MVIETGEPEFFNQKSNNNKPVFEKEKVIN